MANSRKQRYRLDIDDVVKRAFLTKPNADELVRGLNESETDNTLELQVGGTNNPTWSPADDKQFVMFDSVSKSLKPSGYVVLTGAQSIQIPYTTGARYKNDGVNSLSDSSTAIDLVTQDFSLPAASRWVDIHLTFQFTLRGINSGDQHVAMSSLKVLLGTDSAQPVSIISGFPTGSSTATDDTNTYTWVAIGEINSTHILDSDLTVRVSGIPHDLGTLRACVTRVGYRGTVDMPAAVVKGLHNYFTPVLLKHCSWGSSARFTGGATPSFVWESHTLSGVPVTASAAILQVYGAGRRNVVEVWTKPTSAASDSDKLLVFYMETGDEDHAGSNAQITVPFGSSVGVQSLKLEGLTYNLDYGWFKVFLIGYVS